MTLYVEYSIEYGRFLPEKETVAISSTDEINPPENCIIYRLFDRTEVQTEDGETLYGEYRYHPGSVYPKGKIETLEEIELRANPSEHILRDNMRFNNWKAVVKTRFGRTLPFDPEVDSVTP